jgi:membrane protease YdiL (CAAX protease family)
MFLFICGPDFLSIILFGMPLEEGAVRFAGNGWYYLGRDLDFYIEGSSFFAVDSIWRLMPLRVVLPAIQDLILIGIFQLFCLSLLTKYFYANNHIIKNSSKTIDYSLGKSIRFSLEIVLGFGLILSCTEIIGYIFYEKDLIFENLVSNININQQKLVLHPVYFFVFTIVGCFGAAIFEENFFRRYFFPLLRMKMPFVLSAIINSFLFACMHQISDIVNALSKANMLEISWTVMIQTFICGFIGCYIFEKTKSVIGCVLFHFAGNFCLFVLSVFYPLSMFS